MEDYEKMFDKYGELVLSMSEIFSSYLEGTDRVPGLPSNKSYFSDYKFSRN